MVTVINTWLRLGNDHWLLVGNGKEQRSPVLKSDVLWTHPSTRTSSPRWLHRSVITSTDFLLCSCHNYQGHYSQHSAGVAWGSVSECPWMIQPNPRHETFHLICPEEWDRLPKSRCTKLVETLLRRLQLLNSREKLWEQWWVTSWVANKELACHSKLGNVPSSSVNNVSHHSTKPLVPPIWHGQANHSYSVTASPNSCVFN